MKSDSAALEMVIDDLKQHGLLPDQMLADTAPSVRSLIAKLTKGSQAGQSALSFATSYRRQVSCSTLMVA